VRYQRDLGFLRIANDIHSYFYIQQIVSLCSENRQFCEIYEAERTTVRRNNNSSSVSTCLEYAAIALHPQASSIEKAPILQMPDHLKKGGRTRS